MNEDALKLLSKTSPVMPVGYNPATINPTLTKFTATPLQYLKVVLHPLDKMPKWHYAPDQPSLAIVSEIVVN
jgi:hypothetical protein